MRMYHLMNRTQQPKLSPTVSKSRAGKLMSRTCVGGGGEHQGYRAVHVLIRLLNGGAPAEIQVRTALQGAWANLYERLGDHFGRDIRYEACAGSVHPLIENYAAELRQFSVGGITWLEEALRDEMRSRSGEEPVERYATMGVEPAELDARQLFADVEALRRRLEGGAVEGARAIHGMLYVLQERLEAAVRRGKPGRGER